jgi:putative radical SAM enzyme (TIGR03279 family)
MITIAEIEAGSLAEALELRIGTRVIRINGEKVRDGIDLTFLLADGEIELDTVDPDGNRVIYEVERDPGEPMGIIPAPDTVRECANACVFCFIDGNPKDVRPSLWIRDDDFRLSFSYGSFVTLTNLGPKGLSRLVEQRLSPLYVSVHTTDPDLRVRMLKNERSGLIMEQLQELLDGGLEVHTQVVLCPEWNDGAHLERTLEDLWSLGEGIRTLSVVPVGLTKFNVNRPVRPLHPEEADKALAQVEAVRQRGLRERGYGWVYGADEMFLLAGEPLPGPAYYDDASLLENGVGAVRHFLDHLDSELHDLPQLGPKRRVHLLTGSSMGPLLESRSADLSTAVGGAEVSVTAVTNEFYGPLVTVAGLLAGGDLLRAAQSIGPHREGDILLIPGETLNQDDLFIDSLSLEQFRTELSPLTVIPAFEIPQGLRSLA